MCVNSKYSSIILCAILTSISIGFCQNYNLQQFNTVRVAHELYFGINIQNDLTDLYFKRVIKNGYNYVTFDPNFWWTSAQIASKTSEEAIYENVRNDIRSAVINANRFGLRVIPTIGLSSRWAYNQWHPMEIATGKTLCAATYESTGWANFWAPSSEWTKFGSTRWSPDPDGIDIYLPRVFQAIKDGFDAANVSYPLEFIHLGHDEPFCGDRLLIGGVSTINSSSLCYGVQWRNVTHDEVDIAWMNAQRGAGANPSTAVAMLIANEVYRRCNQVQQVFGNKVKTIIWADMWDPGSYGGVDMQIYSGNWDINTAPTILLLPGLTNPQAKFVKDNIILAPWHYKGEKDKKDGSCSANQYSFNEAFNGFANNGFKFMYCGTSEPGGNPLWSKDRQRSEARSAIANAQVNSCNFPSNFLGIFAASWDAGAYNPDPNVYNGYKTLEFMATDNRDECCSSKLPLIPMNDWTFTIDTSKWYRIVFNHSGLCMRPTNGQIGNNIQIEQWSIDNNDKSQLWKFKKGDAPGYYYPINFYGKSFDIYGTNTGSYVGTWDMHNGWNQEFRFDYSPISGNYFMVDLRSANLGTNLTLDVEGESTVAGAKVLTWTKKASGYQNQIIQLIEVPDPNKWYRMKFLHSGKYMRPTGGQYGNNIQIEQTPIINSDTTQIWRFTLGANGYYYPINANRKSFDIYGTTAGSYAGTWDLQNGDNQQFRFDVCPQTEYYFMVNRRSALSSLNLTLDVEEANTADGAKVLTQPEKTTGYENQVIKCEPIVPFIPQGEMVTGLNNDGRLYIFAKGKDNHLYYKLQNSPNDQWPGVWKNLSCNTIAGNIAVGSALSNGVKRMYVFSKGTSNLLTYNYQLTPGVDSWSQSYSIDGVKVDGNIVLSNNYTGELICFAREAAGKSIVWTRHTNDENVPNSWFALSNYVNSSDPKAVDKFAVVQNSNRDLVVIASDFTTKIVNYITSNNGSFEWASCYWKELSSQVTYSGELVAAKNSLGGAEVFMINAGKLYHSWQSSATSPFSGWEQIPGDAQRSLVVAQRTNGYFEVFSQGYRNYITHAWFDGMTWNSLRFLPNSMVSKYGMPIITGNNANGLLTLFATSDSDTEDKIIYSNQTNQSGEGTWASLIKFSVWQ